MENEGKREKVTQREIKGRRYFLEGETIERKTREEEEMRK